MGYADRQEFLREIYEKTKIVRRPVSGIISGYHKLPYILIAPDDENSDHTVEINGTINVSPKFIISPGMLQESFGDVFDVDTFDSALEGRLFSFAYAGKKNLKIENQDFNMTRVVREAQSHLSEIEDRLMQQENTRTGLISCPQFSYYPVSIDRFISEIIDREMQA